MGAVIVIVHGVRIIVERIDTVAVVNITIAIVVLVIVARSLITIHIVDQIGMVVINTGIDDSYDYTTVASGYIPSFKCVDISVREPARLALVVKPPHLARCISWIIWCRCCLQDVIWFRIEYIGVLPINFYCFLNRDVWWQLNHLESLNCLESSF